VFRLFEWRQTVRMHRVQPLITLIAH
jgi:hypothetical protein